VVREFSFARRCFGSQWAVDTEISRQINPISLNGRSVYLRTEV
jgi:hypothetical protein